jgi:hypothetical protein
MPSAVPASRGHRTGKARSADWEHRPRRLSPCHALPSLPGFDDRRRRSTALRFFLSAMTRPQRRTTIPSPLMRQRPRRGVQQFHLPEEGRGLGEGFDDFATPHRSSLAAPTRLRPTGAASRIPESGAQSHGMSGCRRTGRTRVARRHGSRALPADCRRARGP